MLTIRKEQMETLAAANDQLFEQRVIDQIKRHFPERSAELLDRPDGESKLLDWVRKRFDRASEYGMELEGDYAAFVILIMAGQQLRAENAALNGDYLAWTREVLEHQNSPGQVKMAYIEHQLGRQADADERAARLSDMFASVREEFG